MKKVLCKDIEPGSDCAFEASGETNEAVTGKMVKHIKAKHPDMIMGITTAEMKSLIESKIKDE